MGVLLDARKEALVEAELLGMGAGDRTDLESCAADVHIVAVMLHD